VSCGSRQWNLRSEVTLTEDTKIGTDIGGYRILRLLGRGGMSVVYLAEDLRLGRKVAVKVIAPDLAADEGVRDRFLRESNAAASLDDPNVLPIYGAGEADGVLYIAMRYVEGTDLSSAREPWVCHRTHHQKIPRRKLFSRVATSALLLTRLLDDTPPGGSDGAGIYV
jgi:serine/threonine protein kinase